MESAREFELTMQTELHFMLSISSKGARGDGIHLVRDW